MPGFDGTGPLGEGPMTGGGFGYCNPGSAERTGGLAPRGFRGAGRFPGRGLGRGFACGRGYGRGFRSGYYAPEYLPLRYTSEPKVNEKQYLQDELKYLENQVESIKGRLEELNKGQSN
ncbi:MAG: DUF5320 domain-containing protein [Victivallales bacterium]|nr:DUF5320 domain-containing protein [Victivallales bacterium]MCF7889336.1 DUF5320 domain-containing protein [Victivallales bacterium]